MERLRGCVWWWTGSLESRRWLVLVPDARAPRWSCQSRIRCLGLRLFPPRRRKQQPLPCNFRAKEEVCAMLRSIDYAVYKPIPGGFFLDTPPTPCHATTFYKDDAPQRLFLPTTLVKPSSSISGSAFSLGCAATSCGASPMSVSSQSSLSSSSSSSSSSLRSKVPS